MILGDYLRAAAAQPATGVFPCALFAADWLVMCGRADPFDFLRGAPPGDAMRHLARAGSVEALARQAMQRHEGPEVDTPLLGCVGVIARPTLDGRNQACAIYAGTRWVTLGAKGIEAGPADHYAIWRP